MSLNVLRVSLTVLPIISLIISLGLACHILKMDFRRYLTFILINAFISSICLSPVLSLPVFGKLILPLEIVPERFTLAYFFFKLPILYDRVPAYLLVCILIMSAIYICNIFVGTYLTSHLLKFQFGDSLKLSYLTAIFSFTFLSLALLTIRGVITS